MAGIEGFWAPAKGYALGSLEIGKLGDIVVLSEDPFEVEPNQIKEIPIEMTIVGGQIAYKRA